MSLIQSPDALAEFAYHVERHKGPIVCDLETEGLDPYRASHRVVGWAFYLPADDFSCYIPVRHKPFVTSCVGWEAQSYQTPKLKQWKHRNALVATGKRRAFDVNLDPIMVATVLQKAVFNSNRAVINWNMKFDRHFIEAEGVVIRCPTLDAMIAAHLADENQLSYQLDYHGKLRLGEAKADDALDEWAKDTKVGKAKAHLAEAPLYLVAEYAEQDCRLTWKLAEYYKNMLCEEKPTVLRGGTLFSLWPEIGGTYMEAIQRMEKNGVRADRALVEESIALAETKVDELYHAMAKHVGRDFNPRSNPELRKVLGLPKTNKAYLATSPSPTAWLLSEFRQWERALTTYYRPWLEMMDDDGLIHPSLLIHGTKASRLASRSPNMQNLPRSSDVYDVRRSIIAPEGSVLVEADLSQAELRLATHYSMVPEWKDIYLQEGDIHQSTADMVGISRQAAKTLNFA